MQTVFNKNIKVYFIVPNDVSNNEAYFTHTKKANNSSGSLPLTTISYIKSIIGIDTSLSFNTSINSLIMKLLFQMKI